MLPSFFNLKPTDLIVTGIEQTENAQRLLKKALFPVVQVMDICDDPIDMIVGFYHGQAIEQALQHMVDQGFSRIGFIAARMDPRAQKRLQVYRSMMEKRGLYDEQFVISTQAPSSVELGRYLFADLMTKALNCDAVLCNNDDLAVGAALECQRRHIKIPEQMGICSFNDLGTTSQMYPPITSINTPRFESGKKAVEMVLAALEQGDNHKKKIVDLGLTLKTRSSTNKKIRTLQLT